MKHETAMTLKQLMLLRMEVKSQLDQYRFIAEVTGDYYEKEINVLLDRLSEIDRLEKEFKKK